MRFKTTALVLALALAFTLAPAAARAADDGVGTAASLDIGMGARALGMGGAHIAVADDAAAIYYNPAGLALVSGRNVTSLYTSQFGAAGYVALGYAQKNIGVGLLRLDASGIEETDEFANVTGVFGVTDLAAIVGYGATVFSNLSLGASAKLYQQTLPENTGRGVTFDAGAILSLIDGKLRLGAVGRNLIGSLKYTSGETDPFDRSFGVGVAFCPIENLTIAGDAVLKGGFTGKLGAEYRFKQIAVRAGGSFGGGQTSITAGAGFGLPGFSIDYAYQTHNVLPDSHRLSLCVKF
ncbi:MAG TPA: hypothetical protein DCL63_06620 [Firmicutes bacterium]|jgi:hypothetical protein|nr:hypothetical protein [Bacillota bacterium]HBK61872.1 hypothetical protein [Bacillota bacterium]